MWVLGMFRRYPRCEVLVENYFIGPGTFNWRHVDSCNLKRIMLNENAQPLQTIGGE